METTIGYKIKVVQDQDAQRPDTNQDFFPPCLVWVHERYHAKLQEIGMEPSIDWQTLADMVERKHARTAAQRRYLCHIADLSYSDFLSDSRNCAGSDTIERFQNWYYENPLSQPSDWRDAVNYFDSIRMLAEHVGVPCYLEQSNGYSQGDSLLIIAFASEEWLDGWCGSDVEASLKGYVNEYCAWAWGDCYGWVIADDDDDHIESVWGYYGDDHEASGLMNDARACVDHLSEKAKKEAALQHEWDCRN